MIEEILPAGVVAVETRTDAAGVVLFPVEEAAVARAVEKRRREFTTVRACARTAMARLGVAPTAILNGPRGEPLWPAGLVGSLTHCDGYRACALARSSDVVAIGVDAEPHEALRPGLVSSIASEQERGWISDLRRRAPGIHWDRLLFSAKESVYKAWYPLAKQRLSFEHALLRLDPDDGSFRAQLLVPAPSVGGVSLAEISGRWLVRDDLLLTAIAVAYPAPPDPTAR